MTGPRPLRVRVARREVLRNLGYRGAARPRDRVDGRLDELWPDAEQLLRPVGAYRRVDGDQAAAAGMPDPGEAVGVAVCTLGGALEAEARRRSDGGELLDALLLDAFGSAAAEAAADALNLDLCRELARDGLHPSPRISPGYGRWDVRGQRELLALLPTDSLGIRLTPGLMMEPSKSISFAVRLRSRPHRAAARRCGLCDLEDCAYRRSPDDERR